MIIAKKIAEQTNRFISEWSSALDTSVIDN